MRAFSPRISGAAHLRAPVSSVPKSRQTSIAFARCIHIFSPVPSADSALPEMMFDNRCREKGLELSIDATLVKLKCSPSLNHLDGDCGQSTLPAISPAVS